jgi:hypothetical protein
MSATPERIKQLLDELKMFYANIFVLMEQALILDPATQFEQLAELNSRIKNLMMVAAEKSSIFQRLEHDHASSGLALSDQLRREIDDFCSTLPKVLAPLIERLHSSAVELAKERNRLKEQLLNIQQSHKGLGGYILEAQKRPKYLDSKI